MNQWQEFMGKVCGVIESYEAEFVRLLLNRLFQEEGGSSTFDAAIDDLASSHPTVVERLRAMNAKP